MEILRSLVPTIQDIASESEVARRKRLAEEAMLDSIAQRGGVTFASAMRPLVASGLSTGLGLTQRITFGEPVPNMPPAASDSGPSPDESDAKKPLPSRGKAHMFVGRNRQKQEPESKP